MVRDKVVIGSGMIGAAFSRFRGFKGCIIYAAGTSNSSCTRQSEFDRDRERLTDALKNDGLFIYISTTSVEDKPYAHHKRAMEGLVKARGDYLILRLPIVAGQSTNPHTLLNFLNDAISRGEEFDLFYRARRHVIDVEDVVEIAGWLVLSGAINEVVDIVPPHDISVVEIVREFERIKGKQAHYAPVDGGDVPHLSNARISEAFVDFSGDYLQRTLSRYYS